jgi:hypothetical protein
MIKLYLDYYRNLTEEETEYYCEHKDFIKIDKEKFYQRIVHREKQKINKIHNLGELKSCYKEGKNILWLLQK